MKMIYERRCSVAFTGHRTIPSFKEGEVREKVRNEIRLLYSKGFRNFFCGMALGFDMLAAEEVLLLKEELSDILLIGIIPYRGQNERWGISQKIRYNGLLKRLDDAVILSERYFNGCFLKRNDYMLSCASYLVAYYDGKAKGGTFYTVRKGKELGLSIVNLFG